MKGLQISENFYYNEGKPMILKDFPELYPRIAAGLCGEGSECYGFDDEISKDHDFGPGFCIWLLEEDFEKYGSRLQEAYDALPGSKLRDVQPHAGKRVGVFSIKEFYRYFGVEVCAQGGNYRIQSPIHCAPEDRLSSCTNGRVFEDNAGEFTRVRQEICAYYPEDIRVRMIKSCMFRMAQSGQYNYGRCMKRGEYAAAELYKAEFARAALRLMYLLNRQFEPYTKWTHRKALTLPLLKGIPVLIESLLLLPVQENAWRGADIPCINLRDNKVKVIEEICGIFLKELRAQGITDKNDPFLEADL